MRRQRSEQIIYFLIRMVMYSIVLVIGYILFDIIRNGLPALSLFRALMTGHSGACTFHADSPREAARRLATVMGADAGVKPH
ncbi:MAG: Flp pilus assembly complex ATPase component TadA, partial [Proteobacteria bacterium]|nr:Flp pilus assembly complex ATPase component TadA [Pseudomonadota bacterium]